MTEKVDIHLKKDRSYICEICNTNYSSYKSLWNHNNKFHNIKSDNNNFLTTNNNFLTTF